MTNDPKLTKEQVQKFWEWCGFVEVRGKTTGIIMEWTHWVYPNGKQYGKLPNLDLNNIFKHAVPKLDSVKLYKDLLHQQYGAYVVNESTQKEIRIYNADPAMALFWAICEAMDA